MISSGKSAAADHRVDLSSFKIYVTKQPLKITRTCAVKSKDSDKQNKKRWHDLCENQ